jgi:hypothetical protein
MSDQLVSQKLSTLEEAQQKAEDAAAVIQSRFRGSYTRWENERTLRVFNRLDQAIATISLESLS